MEVISVTDVDITDKGYMFIGKIALERDGWKFITTDGECLKIFRKGMKASLNDQYLSNLLFSSSMMNHTWVARGIKLEDCLVVLNMEIV